MNSKLRRYRPNDFSRSTRPCPEEQGDSSDRHTGRDFEKAFQTARARAKSKVGEPKVYCVSGSGHATYAGTLSEAQLAEASEKDGVAMITPLRRKPASRASGFE